MFSNIVLLFLVLAYYHDFWEKGEKMEDSFSHYFLKHRDWQDELYKKMYSITETTSALTQFTCSQLQQCKVDRFVYWLIQRDDITTNVFTYCTVHCTIWLMCYVKMIKRQTHGFIFPVSFFLMRVMSENCHSHTIQPEQETAPQCTNEKTRKAQFQVIKKLSNRQS